MDNEVNNAEDTLQSPSPKQSSESSQDELTLNELYDTAVRTYLENNWDECIVKFEEALKRYKRYFNELIFNISKKF